jgi:hypothetical protein
MAVRHNTRVGVANRLAPYPSGWAKCFRSHKGTPPALSGFPETRVDGMTAFAGIAQSDAAAHHCRGTTTHALLFGGRTPYPAGCQNKMRHRLLMTKCVWLRWVGRGVVFLAVTQLAVGRSARISRQGAMNRGRDRYSSDGGWSGGDIRGISRDRS